MDNQTQKTTIFIITSLLLLITGVAWGDVPATNSIDRIQDIYINNASGWETTLRTYAVRLFWILALIDFVWMAIGLALNPGEFSDITANLIRKILFIGFFFALLLNGPIWAKSIIDSFLRAAGGIIPAGVGTTPADVFDTGFQLAIKIFDAISLSHPVDSLGFVIAGYIIMAVFALISAMMLLVNVQAYITLYAGVILLGFGGSIFTKDIALIYLKSAISVGAKLFVMLLVAGLGVGVVEGWAQTFTDITFKQLCLFIGAAIVLLALIKSIPDMVGDMINGFSWGAGESLTATTFKTGKVIAGGAIGATAGAIGGTMAVREASKMGRDSGASGMIGKTAATVSNLGKAAGQQLGQQITGQGPRHGTATGRTAAILKANRLATSSTPSPNESYPSDAPDLSKTGSIYKDKS
jgi:type IV secretion system protein TrbL